MKIIRLGDYTENGILEDLDDARFFAKKFGPEDHLDFSDIKTISLAYLEVLLEGHDPDSLEDRLEGLSESVDQALVEWLESREKATETMKEKAGGNRNKRIQPQKPKPPKLEFKRPEIEGERYTPTRLVSRLKRDLTSYIESAYPLSDPVLVRARRKLLEEAENGHLLSQEPFVETNPRYKSYDGDYTTLGFSEHIASLFSNLSTNPQQYNADKTVLYPEMWLHQGLITKCGWISPI